MSDTVRIRAGWNDDVEQFWLDTCEPGDTDGEWHSQEGDVPAELWARFLAIRADWSTVEAELLGHIDVVEGGKPAKPCDLFAGTVATHVIPERWVITITPSDEPGVWPRSPYYLHAAETVDEAQQIIDGLPPEIWFWHAGPSPIHVPRERIIIGHRPPHQFTSDCDRCGHAKDEHTEVES